MGVKGCILSRIFESLDGQKIRKIERVAEKVPFLTSNSTRRDNDTVEQEENHE